MLQLFHRAYVAVFRRYPVLGRMAVVVILGEMLFASINNYALSFYVLDDLRQPGRTLGLLASTFLIVEMLLKMPFGHLSDRYGRRLFATAGLTAATITPVVICAVPTELFLAMPALIFLLVLPLRAVDGAGAAALWPPLFAAVSDNVPSRERGAGMAVVNTAYMAGLALGPALAGLAMKVWAAQGLPEHWVGRAPFALAGAAAVAGALVARTLPESRGRPGEAGEKAAPERLPGLHLVVVVILITFGEMFAVATLAPYLAPYVRNVTGLARSDVGLLLLLLFIPAGVLGVPIGHLTDKWPKSVVVQAALWLAAAGLWGVPMFRALLPLLGAGVVVLVGFLFGLPAWLALIADLAPKGKSGRMMGMMATAHGAGAFLGPLVGGHLWDINQRYVWYASACLMTLSAATAQCCLRGLIRGRVAGMGEVQAGSG